MNSTINLGWIRWLATISSLIAIGGLLALMIEKSYALDPPGGFKPGAKAFNPYSAPAANAGAGSTPSPFFEDDEEEDFDMDSGGGYQENPASVGNATAGNRGAGGKKVARTGIQVGGGDRGVIESDKSASQAAALVDNEGAKGSNEIITDFNFPDADILDIAKALGKLTGKNFILDKDVKGRITIISNSPVTVRDAWRAFLTALDMNGFALIPSGNFIRIARQRDARDKQLKTYTGAFSPDSDALITRLFALKYLSAEEVARNFRSFMPANSRIIPYEQTNTVIVTDTGSNISKLSKLLEILDVEGYDAGIEVIAVKYASAVELSKLIDTLIPGTSTNSVGGPRFPTGGGSRFTARKTKEGGVINTIIADERTNNLIIHANSKGADQVRELIAKLDKKLPATMGGGKVHVMYLQFADAEAISQTLSNLTQSAGTSNRTTPRSGGGSSIGSNPLADTASLFEGQIKIAADKSTNSLVITASPTDFSTVQRVINRLDIPRDQVFAEVVIMELQMGKNFNFSANVLSPISGLGSLPNGDLANFIANPLAATGAIIGFRSGGSKTIDINGRSVTVGNIQGLVKALQQTNNANVVATPQILTMDNVEASFISAEKIPVKNSVAANGGVGTNITRENVEISIKMKPQINKMSNYVKLDIDAKLEDFSGRVLPDNVASEALALLSRQAKTTVTVANGDTVVLGGLTRDTAQEKSSKIPILGDIPVLGWLFRSKSTESAKSNLLIFITPTIIRQPAEVRAILDRKLKERDDFVENTGGGFDPSRSTRDDMIRRLPDTKSLDQRPRANYTIDSGNPVGGGGTVGGSSANGSGDDLPGLPNEPGSFQPGNMGPEGFPPPGAYDSPGDLPPPPMGDFEG
jgi:general secretion pathway protein D